MFEITKFISQSVEERERERSCLISKRITNEIEGDLNQERVIKKEASATKKQMVLHFKERDLAPLQ